MTAGGGELFGLSTDVKEALLRRMLELRNQRAGRRQAIPADGESVPPPASDAVRQPEDPICRFDAMPGYRELQVLRAAGERLGIENPYFRLHEGIAGATTDVGGRTLVNYASYNYLDLCGHPDVSQAAKDAIDRYGTSASASRLVSGERPVQRSLERALAAIHGVDDCVVFVSGHATNVTTLGHLFGPKDLIVHDALIHNSALQGAKLSNAKRLSFPHNDWRALDRLLRKSRAGYERVIVVIEGVYSMDGDVPELERFIDVKRRHKAFLMVDEAHSLGVLGANGFGIGEHFGVDRRGVDVWMGTLSKTLASCGGYIAGDKALVDYLKCSAPGFLYSVGMAPPVAAAALAALQVMQREPARVERLRENSALFLRLATEARLDTGHSAGYSVIPIIVGSSAVAARLSNSLLARDINVQPIIYPAVEERGARLRFFMSCAHTEDQIRRTISSLVEEMQKIR